METSLKRRRTVRFDMFSSCARVRGPGVVRSTIAKIGGGELEFGFEEEEACAPPPVLSSSSSSSSSPLSSSSSIASSSVGATSTSAANSASASCNFSRKLCQACSFEKSVRTRMPMPGASDEMGSIGSSSVVYGAVSTSFGGTGGS